MEGFLVQQLGGFLGLGGVNGDEIGAGQEFIQGDQLHPDSRSHFLGDERIKADNPHSESQAPFRHHPADAAQADDPQGLVKHFRSLVFLLFPLPLGHGPVGLGDIAGHGQHEGNGVLGGGDGVAPRGVHDHDALFAGRRDVHVVQSGAGPTHHFQAGSLVDEFGGHLGGAANGQPVDILDGLFQLFRAETRTEIHFDIGVLGQNVHPGFMQIITDQDLHGPMPPCPKSPGRP